MNETPRKTVVVFTHGDASETRVLQMFDSNYTADAAQRMIEDALGKGEIRVRALLQGLSCQDAATIALIDQEVDTMRVNSNDELRRLLSFSISSPPETKEVRQTFYDDVTDAESLFHEYIKARGGKAIDHITALLFTYVQYGDDPSRFAQEAERSASSLGPDERSILLMVFHVLIQKALPAAREKVNREGQRQNYQNN